MLRVSPAFILVFVAAAVLMAFGIHKYIQHTAQVNAVDGRSLSSEAPPTNYETIENIPGDWASQPKADETNCANWAADGSCLSEKE